MTRSATFTLILMFTLITSCSEKNAQENTVFLYQNSVDIAYGSDVCSFAGEPIETVRYGGKITMENGEEHKFMSVECVAGFVLSMENRSKIADIQIVDFAHGQQYLPVNDLIYLQSSLRPSPNGLFLTAIDRSNTRMVEYIYDAYPGNYLEWEEVLELVKEEWNLSS